MHTRIVVVVATMLFSLLAIVVGIVTDLHDRSFPEQLGAESTLHLDFSRSGMDDAAAFAHLRDLDARWDLGLLAVRADLGGDLEGQVFVPLGEGSGLPGRVGWFSGQAAGRVDRAPGALEHSFATGSYLVTEDLAHLDDLTSALAAEGVRVRRVDDTALESAGFLLRQDSFRTTLLAAAALMVAMALLWLSVKARARALRVLAGVPSIRIQVEDLGGFGVLLVGSAVPVAGMASAWVALAHGPRYVPYYVATLLTVQAFLVTVTLLCALAISVLSWPGVALIAQRRPAVRSLSSATTTLKVATFLLVLVAAGPAWLAWQDASSAARQQAQWRSLADEVALAFPGALGEEGFVERRAQMGSVVLDAQERDAAALSYTLDPGLFGESSFGDYEQVALVNERWLRLMAPGGLDGLPAVDPGELPRDLVAALGPDLEIWTRQDRPGSEVLADLSPRRTAGAAEVALAAGGSGELVFSDDALLLVVPDLAMFDDDFLASLASSNNLVLHGLAPTLELLRAHDLEHTLQVRHVAEDGVLHAQYAAYVAWIRGVSLAGLMAAFALAAGISAFITALLRARRDFPLRLAGTSWPEILHGRVSREVLAGGALSAVVLLGQAPGAGTGVALAALLALAAVPLSHLLATRWCFAAVGRRQL